MIQRYIYPIDANLLKDEDGLTYPKSKYTNIELLNETECSQIPGGILIAEGGMGKSTFMESINKTIENARTFRLGEYSGDFSGFSYDLECLKDQTTSIIFDGLDEAPELAKIILRKLKNRNPAVNIWIASRDIPAASSLKNSLSLNSYSLAPLSLMDIKDMAKAGGLDPKAFLKATQRQGILSFCAKPIGCNFAISLFKENKLVSTTQNELWELGIKRLCDENPTDTKHLLTDVHKYTLDEIFECSAWVAMSLSLTNNSFVWKGESSFCPDNHLSISELANQKFSSDLLLNTLKRGTFTSIKENVVRFSHAMFGDYLTAVGFKLFLPSSHWPQLIFNSNYNRVYPQREGASTWLASFNKGILEEIVAIQPELLLASKEAVKNIGFKQLSEELIERAKHIPYLVRYSTSIKSNLHRLENPETLKVVKKYLHNTSIDKDSFDFTVQITEECKFDSVASSLADMVLNKSITISQQETVTSTIARLSNIEAKVKLKSILPIPTDEDPNDNILGNILKSCWPDHISIIELLTCIQEPQNPNLYGSYESFLRNSLAPSIQNKLQKSDALEALNWVQKNIIKDHDNILNLIARIIFAKCWQWADDPIITPHIAGCYLISDKNYSNELFPNSDDIESTKSQTVSREQFDKDLTKRMAVLKCIIKREEDIRFIFNTYPLYTPNDINELARQLLETPYGEFVNKWAKIIIQTIEFTTNLDDHSDLIAQLHNTRPDLIDSFKDYKSRREASITQQREREIKFEETQAKRQANQQVEQNKIDTDIKRLLSAIPDPNSFPGIASWLFSKNGRRNVGEPDLTESPGWEKLNTVEQHNLIYLASDYLQKGKVHPTKFNNFSYTPAQALNLLRIKNPSLYDTLDEAVWQKCSVELLKSTLEQHYDMLAPLFDRLSDKFPKVADNAVLMVTCQEILNNSIYFLNFWGKRLSAELAKKIILQSIQPSIPPQTNYLLLCNLIKVNQETVVSVYINKLLDKQFAPSPAPILNKHIGLALKLNPEVFSLRILKAKEKNKQWGIQWLKSISSRTKNEILNGLKRCDADIVAEYYKWLHSEFPKSPERLGAFTPNFEDYIREIKRGILYLLTDSGKAGTIEAIKMLIATFPSESWLNDCLQKAKDTEAKSQIPILTMKDIQKINDKKSSTKLIHSINDFHDVVLEQLNQYNTYLQGDTPAVVELWNNTANEISAKDEEHFSDHIARYLRLTLTKEIIINREVQIKRKMFKEGSSGSRTDIWIQAIDDKDSVITLCIEVKCNWNTSAKNAIKDQLIEKYLSGGVATGGILLLGWYACSTWSTNDNKCSNATSTWSNLEVAKDDLILKAKSYTLPNKPISSIVIDCSLR